MVDEKDLKLPADETDDGSIEGTDDTEDDTDEDVEDEDNGE